MRPIFRLFSVNNSAEQGTWMLHRVKSHDNFYIPFPSTIQRCPKTTKFVPIATIHVILCRNIDSNGLGNGSTRNFNCGRGWCVLEIFWFFWKHKLADTFPYSSIVQSPRVAMSRVNVWSVLDGTWWIRWRKVEKFPFYLKHRSVYLSDCKWMPFQRRYVETLQ